MTSPEPTYPPPPPPPAAEGAASTLYESSPHQKIDKRAARRRLREAHRAGHYSNPTNVTLLILAAAVVYWLVPLSTLSNFVLYPFRRTPTARHALDTATMPWQKSLTLGPRTKGCHLVTNEIMRQIEEGIKGVKVGLLTLFIQHTSAALTLNENFDKDVRTDMTMALDHVVPESLPWKHTDEGIDDSQSHTLCSLIGPSVTIPITDGRLNLGTWQGVYLCEFRKLSHRRKIVATVLP